MKALAILIDPQGNEFYSSYRGNTTKRDKATRYANAAVAVKAATSQIFGPPDAFWNSEREHARLTREKHRGWSYRVEEVEDSDVRRDGYFLAVYPSVDGGRATYRYAKVDGDAVAWVEDEDAATLWPQRNEALAFCKTLRQPVQHHFAIDNY